MTTYDEKDPTFSKLKDFLEVEDDEHFLHIDDIKTIKIKLDKNDNYDISIEYYKSSITISKDNKRSYNSLLKILKSNHSDENENEDENFQSHHTEIVKLLLKKNTEEDDDKYIVKFSNVSIDKRRLNPDRKSIKNLNVYSLSELKEIADKIGHHAETSKLNKKDLVEYIKNVIDEYEEEMRENKEIERRERIRKIK